MFIVKKKKKNTKIIIEHNEVAAKLAVVNASGYKRCNDAVKGEAIFYPIQMRRIDYLVKKCYYCLRLGASRRLSVIIVHDRYAVFFFVIVRVFFQCLG